VIGALMALKLAPCATGYYTFVGPTQKSPLHIGSIVILPLQRRWSRRCGRSLWLANPLEGDRDDVRPVVDRPYLPPTAENHELRGGSSAVPCLRPGAVGLHRGSENTPPTLDQPWKLLLPSFSK